MLLHSRANKTAAPCSRPGPAASGRRCRTAAEALPPAPAASPAIGSWQDYCQSTAIQLPLPCRDTLACCTCVPDRFTVSVGPDVIQAEVRIARPRLRQAGHSNGHLLCTAACGAGDLATLLLRLAPHLPCALPHLHNAPVPPVPIRPQWLPCRRAGVPGMLCVHWSPQPADELDGRTSRSLLCCLQQATPTRCYAARLANPRLLL